MSAVQSRAEKAAEHSRSGAPPGSKSIAYECTPPRCLQTCTDEPRERIKYAVPLKEQKPCCGADTSPASHFPLRLQPSSTATNQIKLRRLAIFLNGSLSVLALRRTAKVVRFRALAIVSVLLALKTSSRSSLSRSGVQGRRGVPVIFASPSS
jgi:hypothetical protein